MYKTTKIVIGLSMLTLGIWLILAAPTAQAQSKGDTGYLGMGEWRTVASEPDDVC